MQIRQVGDNDHEVMARLRLAFLRDVTAIDGLPEDLARDTLEFFRVEHAAGRIWSWIAEDDAGAAVGAVSLLLRPVPPHPFHPGSREGYVVNMYVEPGSRGVGIGRALMTALMADASEAELRRVCLHASDAGRPLYESLDFAPEPDFLQRWLH